MSSMNVSVNRGKVAWNASLERRMDDVSQRRSKALPGTLLTVALVPIILGGLVSGLIWWAHAGPLLPSVQFARTLTYIIAGSFGGLTAGCMVSAMALKVFQNRVANSIRKGLDPKEFFQEDEVDSILKELKDLDKYLKSGKITLPQPIYEELSDGGRRRDVFGRRWVVTKEYDISKEETWAPLVRYGFIAQEMVHTIQVTRVNVRAQQEAHNGIRVKQAAAKKLMDSEYQKNSRRIDWQEQGKGISNPDELTPYYAAKKLYEAIKMPNVIEVEGLTREKFMAMLDTKCALPRGREDSEEMKERH